MNTNNHPQACFSRLSTALALVAASYALGLGSGCDSADAAGSGGQPGDMEQPNAVTTPASITGQWESLSCEVRPSLNGSTVAPAYVTRKITMGDGKMDLEFHYYADSKCTEPSLTFWFDGTYETLGPSAAVNGALEANLTVLQVATRAESDYAAMLLNGAGEGQCGATTWKKGLKQDITATGCTVLGVSPGQVTKEYELLHVFRDQIFFGARPIDGTALSAPDKRPTALLVPAVRIAP